MLRVSKCTMRPISGRPAPRMSLMVSSACTQPTRPGQHAQYARLGTARRGARRRRLGIETAVARGPSADRRRTPCLRIGRCCRGTFGFPSITQAHRGFTSSGPGSVAPSTMMS
jgi:hypothetical protein